MADKVNTQLRLVTEADELASLASTIKGDFPYSMSMYNVLMMSSEGLLDGFLYEFYVPKNFPDSHIVIYRKSSYPRAMSLHSSKEEVHFLTDVMRSIHFTSLVDWDQALFIYLPKYLVDAVQECLQEHLDKPLCVYPRYNFCYVSPHESTLRCPAGMRVYRLRKPAIKYLLNTSKVWVEEPFDAYCTLVKGLPALGIYLDPEVEKDEVIDLSKLEFTDSEDKPICWVSATHRGPFGMLFTDERYRRRGLASLLVQLMGRLLSVCGQVPHASVDPKNEASYCMFDKRRGWEFTHSIHWLKRSE